MPAEADTELHLLSEQKRVLRREMLKLRRAVPAEGRARADETIRTKAMALTPLREAETVMLYASTPEEIDLFPMMEALLRQGKRVVLPYIVGKGLMEVRSIPRADALVEGAFGIPAPDLARSAPVSPEEIDVVIVPGAAFTPDGGRLGLGGGYYDRFLPRAANALRIALAYDVQIVTEVPTAPHDAYVDYILTERRLMRRKMCNDNLTFEEEV
ncbi:5-formyltetrahydrofolate cyclo-ligase [Selenomonas sp. F0473]|uniref:5-formyltetrahydrofolate cyclo-ligase n=1 Tax=Selenomonas sp. F0473 TaxID=999423 RepID=UPI0025EFC15C|nr:5-formyltetrahydrofolate cyclo-ligase [Selenomonas sp. F0473]